MRSLLFIIPLLFVACSSGKNINKSSDGNKFARKPIVETTDDKLKTETMVIDATMLLATGHPEQAEMRFRQVLANDPRNADACYQISSIMSSDGRYDSALVYARQACAIDNSNVWYDLHLASLLDYLKLFDDEAKVWENVVALNPNVPEYYYELSSVYAKAGNVKNAIAALNRLEKRVGITEPVSLQKSKLWSHAGNENKALQEIEALANTLPDDNRYNGMLAESYMASGQYDKAKARYDKLLASHPDDQYIHISLAEYYKLTKQPRLAYDELCKAMEQDNLATSTKLQVLTKFYSGEQFYGSDSAYAFDLLHRAMARSDDSVTFAAFYGDVLMRQKRYADAARQFRIALAADSSHYEVWEELLVSELLADGDTATLAGHARRASRLFPLHTLPYYVQAVVLHDNGNYNDAIKLARRCEQMGFDKGYLEAETYNLIADCYNRLDDKTCYDYYEKCLKVRPDDHNTLNSYAYRLAVDGVNLDKAEAMSRKSLAAEPDNPFYLDTYAWILHRLGRDKEALSFIERALKRDDQSQEVIDHWNEIRNALK